MTLPHQGAEFSSFGGCLLCASILIILIGSTNLYAAQIQDDLGQPVSLKSPPQRIISLYGGLTEVLIALGLKDRVVAHIQGDASLTDLPTVGTHFQPNVEMILALKPDLVVQGGVPKGMPALKKLEAEGVPVAMFAPHDFAGLFSTIQRLGALTGQEKAAAALNRGLQDRLQQVAERLKGRKPVRVFFEVRYQNLLAVGRGSMVNDIITRAGGVNVVETAQRLAPFSLEALLQAAAGRLPHSAGAHEPESRGHLFPALLPGVAGRAGKEGAGGGRRPLFPPRTPVSRGRGTISPVSPPRTNAKVN